MGNPRRDINRKPLLAGYGENVRSSKLLFSEKLEHRGGKMFDAARLLCIAQVGHGGDSRTICADEIVDEFSIARSWVLFLQILTATPIAFSTLPLKNIRDSTCSSCFVSCKTPGPVFSMRGHSNAIACCDQQSKVIPTRPSRRFDIDMGKLLLSIDAARWRQRQLQLSFSSRLHAASPAGVSPEGSICGSMLVTCHEPPGCRQAVASTACSPLPVSAT